MKTAPPMKTFDFFNTKTLIACNFAAPWGKWTSSSFFEISNLTLTVWSQVVMEMAEILELKTLIQR